MDADEFEKLLVELREGRVDVRVGLEKPHASSNPAVASLLAEQRAERIARGERVAYVYKSPDDGDDDYSIEAGIDAGQARELLAAGAKELGKRTEGPLATRAEKFLAHLGRVRGTSDIAPPCPVCGKREWSIEGLVAAPIFDKTANSSAAKAAPFLQVICTTCYFVLHFAWNLIERDWPENLKAQPVRLRAKEPEGE
jgi:hypothetical protein